MNVSGRFGCSRTVGPIDVGIAQRLAHFSNHLKSFFFYREYGLFFPHRQLCRTLNASTSLFESISWMAGKNVETNVESSG